MKKKTFIIFMTLLLRDPYLKWQSEYKISCMNILLQYTPEKTLKQFQICERLVVM
jgi:hypothetical protein